MSAGQSRGAGPQSSEPSLDTLRSLVTARRARRLSERDLGRALCRVADVERLHQLWLRPTRVVIAAAGRGTRFEGAGPKVLAPGRIGRPLIMRLLDTLAPFDDRPIVVVNPETGPDVMAAVAEDGRHVPEWVVQAEQRGMGHAVLQVESVLREFRGDLVVAWADMGALGERLVFLTGVVHQAVDSPMSLPTKLRDRPYVCMLRAPDGTLTDLLQRREGDTMPSRGESDCGVFWVRAPAVFEWLRGLAASVPAGRIEALNFLPLVRYLALQGEPAHAVNLGTTWESQGVNNVEELARADDCLDRIRRSTGRRLVLAETLDACLDVVTLSSLDADQLQAAQHHVVRRLGAEWGAACRALYPGKQRTIRQVAQGGAGVAAMAPQTQHPRDAAP
jgi:molybdopterin-guanine dinucleotide biosynthesis protein A